MQSVNVKHYKALVCYVVQFKRLYIGIASVFQRESNFIFSLQFNRLLKRYLKNCCLKMVHITNNSVLFITLVMILCIYALSKECNAKPFDLYDEIMGNDEKQLLMRMTELMESIAADDSETDSDRFVSNSNESSQSSASNEIKDMKPGERCILPVHKGLCRALIPRWSYDPNTRECKEFKFGGCDGNGNNFTSRRTCMETCKGI